MLRNKMLDDSNNECEMASVSLLFKNRKRITSEKGITTEHNNNRDYHAFAKLCKQFIFIKKYYKTWGPA